MNELTPEVQAALERWRKWRKRFPGVHHSPGDTLADAFAALHPEPTPELGPGVYDCDWCGKPSILLVRASERLKYVVVCKDVEQSPHTGGNPVVSLTQVAGPSMPENVTNIRRIDDPAAWREWATRPRHAGNMVWQLRYAAEELGHVGCLELTKRILSAAADELETLLKETP